MITDQTLLRRAAEHFGVHQDFRPMGSGHINDTFVSLDGLHVLQRINKNVFSDPSALMDNIDKVTSHLLRKGQALGEDTGRTVLQFQRTAEGNLFIEEKGQIYRMAPFIAGSAVIGPGNCSRRELRECGLGFGRFLDRLSDMDASALSETIPFFHDTPKRFSDLWEAAEQDPVGRAASTKEELDFAGRHAALAPLITDGLAEGSIPLRVTHNDTKINNILFDAGTRRALCVIDLDTVMPGSLLYDYGDALRTAAAAAAEDETDLSKIGVDLKAFEAFSAGFLSMAGASMSKREWELLPEAFLLMTLECGIRFLEDYLRGDVYFKTGRPCHNLDRARNQFEMVKKIEASLGDLREIILSEQELHRSCK